MIVYRNSATHLVWSESSSVQGGHSADDRDKRDHHDEDIFRVHGLDVGEALEDHHSQPKEVHGGKQKPNHLNKRGKDVRLHNIQRHGCNINTG